MRVWQWLVQLAGRMVLILLFVIGDIQLSSANASVWLVNLQLASDAGGVAADSTFLPHAEWQGITDILFGILLLVAFILLMVLLWNKRLHREILRRRNTEQRLLNSQRIAAIGSWELFISEKCMHWSDEMHRILGVDECQDDNCYSEFLGQIYSADRALVEANLYAAMSGAEELDCQFRVGDSKGYIRYVRCQGTCVGEALQGTLQDVTDSYLSELFFQQLAHDVVGRHGDDYFLALARLLAKTFNISYVLIGLRHPVDDQRIDSLVFIADGEPADRFHYYLADTPCQSVIEARVCFYPDNLQQRYPQAAMLQKLQAESYAGIPLFNSAGECNGLIAMLDRKPMLNEQAVMAILQVAASRASSELQEQQADQQLQLSALVFSNTHEGIVITDEAGCIIRVNSAFTRITGYSEAAAMGKRPEFLFSQDHHDHHFIFLLRQILEEQGRWQGELWNQRQDGSVFPVLQSIDRITGSDGQVLHYISVFRDITDKKADEERIQYLAHFDVITGLPNRVLFNDRLEKAMQRAERYECQLGLMFIDLDRFKYINDTLGHAVGDQLLQVVARRLEACCRQLDTISRFGGDEFVVLIEDLVKPAMLQQLADKIMSELAAPVKLAEHAVNVCCSIGMCVYPDNGNNAELLLKHADMAMYLAKESGRNQSAWYTPELGVRASSNYALERQLRRAIENKQLRLHFQPQVRLSSGRLESFEALVRWQQDDGLLVGPDQFIPLAEESGLIVPLGKWVLLEACQQMRRWLDQGLSLRVAVNISGLQVTHGDWLQTVKDVLSEADLPASHLELELTESYVIRHVDQVVETMAELRELGVRVSVDDFGTGYSSLSYLKQLPVDALKIDRSFLQDVPGSISDGKIVAAIIAMAAQLGLEVVAEGVEHAAQLSFLSQKDCDLVQGFLIARPQSVAELDEWIVRHYQHKAVQRL